MVLRRSFATLLMQLVQLASFVAVSAVVTRSTGAQGKGIYTLLTTIVSLTTMVAGLGIGWAAIHYIGRREHQREALAANVFAAGLVSSAASVVGLAIAYMAFRGSFFQAVSPEQIWLTLVLLPLVQESQAGGQILLGSNKPVHFAGLSAAQLAVTLVVQVGLLLVGMLTITTALAAWCAGAGISLVAGLLMVNKTIPLRLQVDRAVMTMLFRFGSLGYLANLGSFLNYRLDALVVSAVAGAKNLGYYSISVAMTEVIWFASGSVSTVLFPLISSVDRSEANRILPIACRNTLLVSALGMLVMFVVGSPLLVALFGSAMLPAVPALRLLLPGTLALGVARVATSYLSGIGRPVYATLIGTSTAVLTVGLDLLLIPRFGIAGAAVTSSMVYTVVGLAAMIALRHESHVSFRSMLVPRPGDLSIYLTALRGAMSSLRLRSI